MTSMFRALVVAVALVFTATATAATPAHVEQLVRTDLVSTAIAASWYGPHAWVDDYTLVWADVSTETAVRCHRATSGWSCPWRIRETVDATGELVATFVGCRRLRAGPHGLVIRETADCGQRRRGLSTSHS